MVGIAGRDVSRETFEKLKTYQALVERWSPKINLVSRGDFSQIWERHIADSVQVYTVAPEGAHWVDLGSGGGFPGIVCAILSSGEEPERHFTLVDSDQRKCVFLRTVARELNLDVEVLSERIEEIAPMDADILSARALGDLDNLLGFASRHLRAGGVAIFPKGRRWKEEDVSARNTWSYMLDPVKSNTNPDATILKITELSRV